MTTTTSTPVASVCGMERRIADCTEPVHDASWPQAFFCLVGMALGDALGSPFESRTPFEVLQAWPIGTSYPFRLIGAQGAIWTDDTQHSLSLIESIMSSRLQGHPRALLDVNIVSSLWQTLATMEQATPSRSSLGGFRGTGHNFRETVAKMKDAPGHDPTAHTAGNGAAMRVMPLALASHDITLSPAERLPLLHRNVIGSASLTTHHVLAVVPSFSVAYLAWRWTDPNREIRDSFLQSPIQDQLVDVARETRAFEDIIAASHFFVRSQSDRAMVHNYSEFLVALSRLLFSESKSRSPEGVYAIVNEFTVRYCRGQTSKDIRTMNDGMAIASVTSAIAGALLLKVRPFLGALQIAYSFGGDTDTVGAMFGGLLGAAHCHISPIVTNQLIMKDDLFAVFRSFAGWLRLPAGSLPPPCPKFVELERSVTFGIRSAAATTGGHGHKHH